MTPQLDKSGMDDLFEKHGDRPITCKDLYGAYTDTMIGILKSLKEKTEARVAALEARVTELEARPELKFLGVWEATKKYPVNSAVTHAGSIWIAKTESISVQPGGNACWQLACKRGRDGKDLR